MLKYGIVSEYAKGKAKVKFEDDNIVTDWLPVVCGNTLKDKDICFLSIKEHVACIMNENGDSGVILGAIYSEVDEVSEADNGKKWGREFEDGTIITYNPTDKELKISGSGLKVKIEGDVNVTGKIECSGNIESGGDIKTSTVSVNTHIHSGVTTGPGSTGPPTPSI